MNENKLKNAILCELGLSDSFLKTSGLMGFQTVGDILETAPEELINKEGFTYNWLSELIKFLSKCQATHLLQPLPGNSHG